MADDSQRHDGSTQEILVNIASRDLSLTTLSVNTPNGDAEDGEKSSSSSSNNSSSTKRRRKKKKIPSIRVFCGTFVHSTWEEPLVIQRRWMVGVNHGKIVFSASVHKYKEYVARYKLHNFQRECVISMPENSFMLPGFVDAHAQAVGYLTSGLQMEGEEATNGHSRRRQEKLNMIHDDRIAKNVFTKVVEQTLANGTTSIAFNGTNIESAARLLADALARGRQRAFVGMDMDMRENKHDIHLLQLAKMRDTVRHVLRKEGSRVRPHVMLSRPLPMWIEEKVAAIRHELDAPLKCVVGAVPEADCRASVAGFADLWHEESDLEYHQRLGLLDDKSVVVFGPHYGDRDLARVKDVGVGVVYCPGADMHECTSTNLAQILETTDKVGLGSDITRSDTLSMIHVMRQCVQMLRQAKAGPGRKGAPPGECEQQNPLPALPVSYKQLFRMATLGGASVLGLDEQTGNFVVGKEFDALLVDPSAPSSPLLTLPGKDTVEDLLQKFLFLGDDRNIAQVYISGQRVK